MEMAKKNCRYKVGDLVHLKGQKYYYITDIVSKADYPYYRVYDIRNPDTIVDKETTLFEKIVELNNRINDETVI